MTQAEISKAIIELLDKAVQNAGLSESPFAYLWQKDWDKLNKLARMLMETTKTAGGD